MNKPEYKSSSSDEFQRWSRLISLETLQGRMLIFVILFVCLLLGFSAVILWQNRQSNLLTKEIEAFDTQKLILLSQIQQGIEQSVSLHQLYLLNADQTYQSLRKALWKSKVDSCFQRIRAIQSDFDKEDVLSKKTPLLKILLSDFRSAIDQAEQIYARESQDIRESLVTEDSLDLLQPMEAHQLIPEKVNLSIRKEVLPAKEKLNALIQTLLLENNKTTKLHVDQVQDKTNWTNIFTIYVMVFAILYSVGFTVYNVHRLTESVEKPTALIRMLSRGEIPEQMNATRDELSRMVDASNLLSINLKNASHFAKSIGEGKFDSEFSPISEKDVLGNSLVQMRKRLQEVSEEDKKRNWVTQGLAKFADIIRSNNFDFKSLGESTLIALIEYLGANQGGVFIANPGEDESYIQLDMIACYAYDRKKYINKQIKVHFDHAESLLGQVYLEREKIYLSQIPEDYLSISSGLGEASARYLLLSPLKLNDSVEGVLEIASLHELEVYQIEFIERICESIASAILSIKNSERTRQLVKELQNQTDMMRAQEEDMRKNMEELTVTQEEMKAKQLELERLKENLESEVKKRTQELEESLIRFNLIIQSSSEGLWDMIVPPKGIITPETPFIWSENLKRSLGYADEEFPNVLDSWASRLHPEDREALFKAFLIHIKDTSGKTPFEKEHRILVKSGEYRWFKASCHTLRDKQGNALRVAGYINDISHQKQLEAVLSELKNKSEQMEIAHEKMRANTEILEKALKKTRQKELELKKINEVLAANEERFKNITQNVPGIIYQLEYDQETNKGLFTYVSDYVKNVLSYTPEEFLQLDMESLHKAIHPEEIESYFAEALQSIKTLKSFLWEGRIADKQQYWKWVRITSTPRLMGKKVVFDGIIQDITENKLQEEELKRMTTEILIREEELRQNYEDLANMQAQFKNNNA